MFSLLAISRAPGLTFDGCCTISLLGPAVSLGVSQLGKQHAMMYKSASLGFCTPRAAAVAIIVGFRYRNVPDRLFDNYFSTFTATTSSMSLFI